MRQGAWSSTTACIASALTGEGQSVLTGREREPCQHGRRGACNRRVRTLVWSAATARVRVHERVLGQA
eukprot:4422436-Pleurochrysis_carterae.AAC.2